MNLNRTVETNCGCGLLDKPLKHYIDNETHLIDHQTSSAVRNNYKVDLYHPLQNAQLYRGVALTTFALSCG